MSAIARPRALEAKPVERRGESRIGLCDPLGVAPNTAGFAAVVERELWSVARLFDGESTAADVARRARAELGLAVEPERVANLADELGAKLLLDDANSRSAIERAADEFDARSVRAAIGAGRDYPADPFELRMSIGGMVADDWDMPPPERVAAAWTSESNLRAARAIHGRTWAALRHQAKAFERVVLIGLSRAALADPLIALDKPFATPLGEVPIDRELVARLPRASRASRLAHRASLGLERQALFVALLLRGVPIVPILLADSEFGAPNALLASLAAPKTLFLFAADLREEHVDAAPIAGAPHGRLAIDPRTGASPPTLLVHDANRRRSTDRDRAILDAVLEPRRDALREFHAREEVAFRKSTIAGLDAWLAARSPSCARRAGPETRTLLGSATIRSESATISCASMIATEMDSGASDRPVS